LLAKVKQAQQWLYKTYVAVGVKHLQKYLDEYCYRYNEQTRAKRGEYPVQQKENLAQKAYPVQQKEYLAQKAYPVQQKEYLAQKAYLVQQKEYPIQPTECQVQQAGYPVQQEMYRAPSKEDPFLQSGETQFQNGKPHTLEEGWATATIRLHTSDSRFSSDNRRLPLERSRGNLAGTEDHFVFGSLLQLCAREKAVTYRDIICSMPIHMEIGTIRAIAA
jgi:hypothetical protein